MGTLKKKKEVRFESEQLHLLTTLNGEIRA